jgi:putative restriction endonuclease
MPVKNWSNDELIVALNLYYKLGFTNVKYTHPKVIELSQILNRTPSAVAYKLVNFARLDPELQKRGVKGMSHGSKGEEIVWNEFNGDLEKIAQASEPLLAEFRKIPLEESIGINTYDLPKEGKERDAVVKVRVNQYFFRDVLLALYKNVCCVTGISTPSLLVAGHILPWAKSKDNRMNLSNGICLNALHDRAFESGLISITPDYQIKVSSLLKKQNKNQNIQEYFLKYEDEKIILPHVHLPNPDFLNEHYTKRFKK